MKDNTVNKNIIKCAVIGYGPAFNMGKAHCDQIKATEGLKLVAVCDADPKRTEAARKDFPEIKTYEDLGKMLDDAEFDLVTVVTPHNTHAKLALQCLKAGKHVIVEKPMCITTYEATAMIDEAKKRRLMLTVYHNRRLDGDFLALKETIHQGLIGQVFHVESFMGGYGHPGTWWRSNKKISGGAFYDWGAHLLDWILNIVPSRIVGVTGCFHKLVWMDVTNEDQVEALIRFENGAVADVQLSSLASIGKPRWRILGTNGGITSVHDQQYFRMVTYSDNKPVETKIQFWKGEHSAYYRNIADHLLRGAELLVKPEEARRVIAIMEAAEESSKTCKTVKPAYP
ncbi:MAG: Gfo/Idh/MocA family oxidoreductase [Candidatus Bathyarchaeia archaeon]